MQIKTIEMSIKEIYDYLYYCYYDAVLKRPNDTSHHRASLLLSLSTSFIVFSGYTFFNIKDVSRATHDNNLIYCHY